MQDTRTPLQAQEIEQYETLVRLVGGGLGNASDGLVRTTLARDIPAGTEIAAIVGIVKVEDGYDVSPLAILVDFDDVDAPPGAEVRAT